MITPNHIAQSSSGCINKIIFATMSRFTFISYILLLTPVMNFAIEADSTEPGGPTSYESPRKLGRSNYEIWAADQSSTVPNQIALGARGGRLWIWKDKAIQGTISNKTTPPLPCKPKPSSGPWVGPCDLFDIFPGSLSQMNSTGPTGKTLQELDNIGVWHGLVKDPSNKYVLASLFARGGGYVGIIDTRTRGAVALFRVTKYRHEGITTGTTPSGDRSVHMTLWTSGN